MDRLGPCKKPMLTINKKNMEVNKEEVNEAVENAMAEGDGAAAETTAEEETSTKEVKNEQTTETPNEVEEPAKDVDKVLEQVNNLNVALKQERESSKAAKAKLEELQKRLEESNQTIEKLKGVFVSDEKTQETTEEETVGLTIEQVEELLERKEAERRAEEEKAKQAELVKSEVAELEKEWDGTDGKPKYVDSEVLKWQEENGKLYLSPKEAFNEMNRDAIIDWEIKKRLSSKPDVQNVETSGTANQEKKPAETKLTSDEDLRAAIASAIDEADNN